MQKQSYRFPEDQPMEESGHVPLLLLEKVEDINQEWVEGLLNNRDDWQDARPQIRVRSWRRDKCPSESELAGLSSSRATLTVEYDMEESNGMTQTKEETFIVKVLPTHGMMAEVLTLEAMHHTEVGQYQHFLRTLRQWEKERRGSNCIVEELVPTHALAVSTDKHFTIVLPDLRSHGYKVLDLESGLNEEQALTAAAKIGRFQGTVVAFKRLTGTDLQKAFPNCFNKTSTESPSLAFYGKPSFEMLRTQWSGDPERIRLLKSLKPYEEHLELVVGGLTPQEPFATAIHSDLQGSNMFYKDTPYGELTLKLIDWAAARYTLGPLDLVYMLNISLTLDIRRKVSQRATEVYYQAFNNALEELGAGLKYPRSTFQSQLTLSKQMMVTWSIMCINMFVLSPDLMERLYGILCDLLADPEVRSPQLPTKTSTSPVLNHSNFHPS